MNQHLVSQVLLRRFSNHKGGRVAALDLDELGEREARVRDLGSLQDFMPTGADETEQTWQTVERRLSYAFSLLDKKKILDDPDELETIRNCIALHWSRSVAVAVMFGHMQDHYADKVATDLLNEFSPTTALEALTGGLVVPPGLNAYDVAHERIRKEFHTDIEHRQFKAKLLLDFFDHEHPPVPWRHHL